MQLHNIFNHSQLAMNNTLDSDPKPSPSQNQQQNPQQILQLTQIPFSNTQNHLKQPIHLRKTHLPRIPSTMKSFLKNKRITSEILQNSHNINQRNIQNPHKISEQIDLNPQQISKINKVNSVKAYNSQHNTTQTLNDEDKSHNQNVCKICEGKITQKMLKQKVFDCDHLFCAQCTKSYIEFKIKMYEQVICPNQNCKGNLNQKSSFYCNQIALKQRKVYLKIHKFFEINQSGGTKRLCPQQQCDGVIEMILNQDYNKCQVCGFQICSKCYSGMHQGECEDYETKFVKQAYNLVRCDKCKNFIQKSQGCHHISCKCGYQFCQKCKQVWQKRHICRYTGLSSAVYGWGGCDWGITTKDHIMFILKLPVKLFLLVLLSIGWIIFSFLGAPLNVVLMIYWLYLLMIKPSIQMIKIQKECWKILLQIIFFPIFMFRNLLQGWKYLVEHLDRLLPEISNSYRTIMRI